MCVRVEKPRGELFFLTKVLLLAAIDVMFRCCLSMCGNVMTAGSRFSHVYTLHGLRYRHGCVCVCVCLYVCVCALYVLGANIQESDSMSIGSFPICVSLLAYIRRAIGFSKSC